MSETRVHQLFEVVGVEIEHMIVDADSMAIRPVADRILQLDNKPVLQISLADGLAVSNELAAHVIELKNAEPVTQVASLWQPFQREVRRLDAELRTHDCRLMPGAMHPFMNPRSELTLWPHEQFDIYRAFDRHFDCRRHGWANLQSVHINLPFANDEEFVALHAAIRVFLPLVPALAAASPWAHGDTHSRLCKRIEHYARHCDRLPVLTGQVIPEVISSVEDYRRRILDPIQRAIDSDVVMSDILEAEWANARGCIARFDRDAIEVRLIDAQECIAADLAVVTMVIAGIRGLCDEKWSDVSLQNALPTKRLRQLLDSCCEHGADAVVNIDGYAALFGWTGAAAPTVQELLQDVMQRLTDDGTLERQPFADQMDVILNHGPLAKRLVARYGQQPDAHQMLTACRELADCLLEDRMVRP